MINHLKNDDNLKSKLFYFLASNEHYGMSICEALIDKQQAIPELIVVAQERAKHANPEVHYAP